MCVVVWCEGEGEWEEEEGGWRWRNLWNVCLMCVPATAPTYHIMPLLSCLPLPTQHHVWGGRGRQICLRLPPSKCGGGRHPPSSTIPPLSHFGRHSMPGGGYPCGTSMLFLPFSCPPYSVGGGYLYGGREEDVSGEVVMSILIMCVPFCLFF